MRSIFTAGVLAVGLTPLALQARNPLASLGRMVRRVASVEPALAQRFSSWRIPGGCEMSVRLESLSPEQEHSSKRVRGALRDRECGQRDPHR